LTWGSSADADSYQFCYDTTIDGSCGGGWTSTTGTSGSLPGLSRRVTYEWQVRAVNDDGTTEANSGTWWTFVTN
jgi:hypothetical protein